MTYQFSASVLRYVDDARSGEALNVGVILECPELRFVRAAVLGQFSRITAAFPGSDYVTLRRSLAAVEDAAAEVQARLEHELDLTSASPLEELSAKFRTGFDAGLQLSPLIIGITKNPADTLEDLFASFVGRHQKENLPAAERGRSDAEVWAQFAKRLTNPHVLSRMQRYVVHGPLDWKFDHAWKNGAWNAVEPVSLDLSQPSEIKLKAAQKAGVYRAVADAPDMGSIYLLVGRPVQPRTPELLEAAEVGLEILKGQLKGSDVRVVADETNEAEQLVQRITEDVESH